MAAPRAVTTRPAEMTPTWSRAGRRPSNCIIADDPHKSCRFVPVPHCGYRTVTADFSAAVEPGLRSVLLAPPPAPAAGGADLESGQQIGDRLPFAAPARRFGGIIVAAVAGGRIVTRRHRPHMRQTAPVGTCLAS